MLTTGYQYTRVSGTAAGSAVITASSGRVFKGLVIGDEKEGTVTFYDAATAAGTSASNLIASVRNQTGGTTTPLSLDFEITVNNGLVAYKGGTTDMVVVWN